MGASSAAGVAAFSAAGVAAFSAASVAAFSTTSVAAFLAVGVVAFSAASVAAFSAAGVAAFSAVGVLSCLRSVMGLATRRYRQTDDDKANISKAKVINLQILSSQVCRFNRISDSDMGSIGKVIMINDMYNFC